MLILCKYFVGTRIGLKSKHEFFYTHTHAYVIEI